MKAIASNAKLWGTSRLQIGEAIQGSLRNCYVFAVLSSLININGEEYIRAAIPYYNEVIFIKTNKIKNNIIYIIEK